ncbi:hypothetical protein VCR17J2_640057 [Vibrio coralliirubri]|nr:hypothetical protein VCR17J2_640057 [Vibrio coralliirubri]
MCFIYLIDVSIPVSSKENKREYWWMENGAVTVENSVIESDFCGSREARWDDTKRG